MAGRRPVLTLLLLLAICLSGGSVFSFYGLLYEQNKKLEPTVILVEKGVSMGEIAGQLKKDELIKSVSVFKVAARLSGKSTRLRAGEYRIPPRASTKMILDILVNGQNVVRRITVPEGKTSAQIFDLLLQTAGLTGDLPPVPPNGTLLPETYTFSYGVPRTVILQRMRESMTKTVDDLWPYRDPDLPYTTKNEALTLASIVEKETSVPEERPRIAGVFINRLKQGMRLQTDPTVIYAITDGTMDLSRRLTHADLRVDHPFNTYTRKGLPPAPICNPGRDSILAVLKPAKTDEIYFVADGTGGHTFSKTFAQHKRNIAAWKRARRKKRLAFKQQANKKNISKPSLKKASAAASHPAPAKGQTSPQNDTVAINSIDEATAIALDPSEVSANLMEDLIKDDPAEKAVPEKAEKERNAKPEKATAKSKQETKRKNAVSKPDGTASKPKSKTEAAVKSKSAAKTAKPAAKAKAVPAEKKAQSPAAVPQTPENTAKNKPAAAKKPASAPTKAPQKEKPN